MNVKDIRRRNLRILARSVGGISLLAKRLGKSQSQLSQIIGSSATKNIGDKISSQVEDAFDKPRGWLDVLHPGIAEPNAKYYIKNLDTYHQPLPLISWQQAKEFFDSENPVLPTRYERLIASTFEVGPRSFVSRVQTDMMEQTVGTSFPDGAMIIVDPDAQIYNGAYVIASFELNKDLTFKQLLIDGDHYYLKPLNPRYPVKEINDTKRVHAVVRQMIIEFR